MKKYTEREWEIRKSQEIKLWLFYFLQIFLLVSICSVPLFGFKERASNFQLVLFFMTLILICTAAWKGKVRESLRGEGTLNPRQYRSFLRVFYICLMLFSISQSVYWIRVLTN